MSDKVEVAAIQIQYADGEGKQLSIEDAKELYRQLNELFGDKSVVIPQVPLIIERERHPYWRPYVTYDNTSPKFTNEPLDGTTKIWCCAKTDV